MGISGLGQLRHSLLKGECNAVSDAQKTSLCASCRQPRLDARINTAICYVVTCLFCLGAYTCVGTEGGVAGTAVQRLSTAPKVLSAEQEKRVAENGWF